MKIKKKVLSGLLAAMALLPGYAAAEYHASSDTGMDALDYIENRRRAERENALTDEQKQLLADAEEMRAHLRKPWDETKPVPVAFEGDDLTYDERTGDFIAKGEVHILRMDAVRFQSQDVTGNIKEEHVEAPGKVHLLRMTPGFTKVTLDGYRANYNYGAQTGSLEDASGKADRHYVTGKRFEFYPDHIVIYDGTETRCSAKRPDYHTSAEKIEIWPDNKAKLYKVRFWIGKYQVAKRDYYETGIGANAESSPVMPHVGYNNSDGLYLKHTYTVPLGAHFAANANLFAGTADGFRSNADIVYQNRNTSARVVYGYFEDSDDVWIQKLPSFIYTFGKHMKGLPLAYAVSYEHGRWRQNGVKSTHRYYVAGISHDPIELAKGTTLNLNAAYSITKESYDDSTVRGISWNALLLRDFDPRWSAYFGYHYSKENKDRALFSFDQSDYEKKLESGVSYRVDDHNRLAVGIGYDVDRSQTRDVDYYWYHDMHCAEMILRYRAKRDSLQVKWQFTPW